MPRWPERTGPWNPEEERRRRLAYLARPEVKLHNQRRRRERDLLNKEAIAAKQKEYQREYHQRKRAEKRSYCQMGYVKDKALKVRQTLEWKEKERKRHELRTEIERMRELGLTNTTIHLLAGVSGPGKSRMVKALTGVHHVDYDKVTDVSLALFGAVRQPLPIVLDVPIGVSTIMKRNPQYTWKLYCIVETPEVIRARLDSRGGVFGRSMSRIKRMAKLAKQAHFSGTYDEVDAQLRRDLCLP